MRRLGLSIPADGVPLAALPALAARAEQLGFTDGWSFEVNGFDAFTPLAAAAVTTSKMRLGTAIVPAYTRPAGLIAMHAAAMADLAPGRFVLGLGCSTPTVVETWLEVPFSKPLSTVRDTALKVRRLLAGEKVGALRLSAPPAAEVPIFVAALGDRMLRMAGEVGEGVAFYMAGPRIIPELLEQVGRPVDSVARIVVLPGERQGSIAAAQGVIATYALVPYYARLLARQGFGEEVTAIGERWASGDRAGARAQVSHAMVAELVIAGDVDAIAAGIEAYWRAGLGTPVLAFAGTSAAELESLVAACGELVTSR
jgi:alkanesulfonate monooxygenase SsuD/methylene tetrahydromethanopterin reductase-like flavin-dependent oxidoreductase (luciferase family)